MQRFKRDSDCYLEYIVKQGNETIVKSTKDDDKKDDKEK